MLLFLHGRWWLLFAVFWMNQPTGKVNCALFTKWETATIDDVYTATTSGGVSCVHVITGFLERMRRLSHRGPGLHAIVGINIHAMKDAADLDASFKATGKPRGFLHCVPVVVEDSMDVADMATTFGLKAFIYQVTQLDASVVSNMKEQGAVILGKANVAPLSENSAWTQSETTGLVLNPYGLNYTTYGSSGGSAATVAASLAVLSIAKDKSISVNLVSSATNVVGFRPPVEVLKKQLYGVLSDMIPVTSIGPIAKTVKDAAIAMDAMMGFDKPIFSATLSDAHDLHNVHINVFANLVGGNFAVPGFGEYKVDPQILKMFDVVLQRMKKAGAEVHNKMLHNFVLTNLYPKLWDSSATACASEWRDLYFDDSVRFTEFSPFHSVKDIIASHKLPIEVEKKWLNEVEESHIAGLCDKHMMNFKKNRQMLTRRVAEILVADGDVVIWPALPQFPALINPQRNNNTSDNRHLVPINFLQLSALTGYASITVPMGFSRGPVPLPIGLHFLAHPKKLQTLIRVAHIYQNYLSPLTKFIVPPSVREIKPTIATNTTTSVTMDHKFRSRPRDKSSAIRIDCPLLSKWLVISLSWFSIMIVAYPLEY